MANTMKRLLSFALALVMVLGLLPVVQLEAKAEIQQTAGTTDVPMEPTVTAPVEPTVVTPEDKEAPENINGKLPFEGAEGGTAMCYACGKEVQWTALTADYVSPDSSTSAGHYYVPNSEAEELYIAGKNKNYFFMQVSSGTVCLHLNGNDLHTKYLLYVSSGVLNLMGEGTYYGEYDIYPYESFRGSSIHMNPGNKYSSGKVNLYGGTIKAGGSAVNAVSVGTVSSAIDQTELNIYEGVTIEDGFYTQAGIVNMYGGTMDCNVTVRNTWNLNNSDYTKTEFNMFDGAVVNGQIKVFKDAKADHTTESDTETVVEETGKNDTEYVVFNMYGGMVNGLGTLDAPSTEGNGAAFYLEQGAELNIHGGTINGGYVSSNYGGAIYAASASVKNTDGTKRKTLINMTGGIINGQQGTFTNVQNESGNKVAGKLETYTSAASGGGCLHLYESTNGEMEFNMFGGTINGSFSRGGSVFSDGATINLCGDALIQNGSAPLKGGNIYLYQKAVLNIFDNATIQNGVVYCTAIDNKALGGNIYVMQDAVVNVCGGKILNGETYAHSEGGGNIALCTGAVLNIYDGELKGGISHSNAGGNVYMQAGAEMNMYGGTLTGGAHPTVKVDACYGGNIYMAKGNTSSYGVLNMYGGTMTGAVTLQPGVSDSWGVGANIYGGAYAQVNILGGTVKDGTAKNKYVFSDNYAENKRYLGAFGGGNIYMIGTGATLTVGKNPETGALGQVLGGQAIAGGSIAARDGGKIILNDGALVSGGTATGTGTGYKASMETNYGGGNIYVYNSTLEINTGAVVSGGYATAYGGNILAEGTFATVTIAGGTVHQGETDYGVLRESKTYHAYMGGNIAVGGGATLNMTSGIVKNATAATYGGNIYITGSSVTIANATISNGITTTTTTNGYTGGGNITFAGSGKTLAITDSWILNGKSVSGGNILTQSGTVLNLNNTVVSGGEAEGTGSQATGGNLQTSGGTININAKSVVSDGRAALNKGTEAGAIYGGNITLNGGTLGTSETKDNSAVYLYSSSSNGTSKFVAENGVAYGNLEFGSTSLVAAEIKHGVFSMDPTAVAGTAVVKQNAEGLYEVHASEPTLNTVAATCTEDGYTAYTCTMEGCTGYKTNVTPKHTQTEIPAEESSCTVAGHKAYYDCSCEKYYEDAACEKEITDLTEWLAGDGALELADHAWTAKDAVTATCAAKGNVAYYDCDNCDALAVKEGEAYEIKPWGEIETSIDEENHDLAAIWTEGKKACSRCEYVLECEHSDTALDETTKKEATCYAEGYTGDTKCTECGVVTETGRDISKDSIPHGTAYKAAENADQHIKYCPVEGCTWSETENHTYVDGKCVCDKAEAADVVQIGDKGYKTLAEAVAEAQENDVIVLLENVTVTAPVVIPTGVAVNLNGKVLSGTVLGTLKMNGGLLVTAEGYKMFGVGADYYATENAELFMDAAGTVKLVSGEVTLVKNEWWSLPGQKLIVAEGATFTIPTGKVLQINGTQVVVEGTAVVDGAVNLYSVDAAIQAAEGLNVTTTVADYEVVYADGVYSLKHKQVVVVTPENVTVGGSVATEEQKEAVENIITQVVQNQAADKVETGLVANDAANAKLKQALQTAGKTEEEAAKAVQNAQTAVFIELTEVSVSENNEATKLTYDVEPVLLYEDVKVKIENPGKIKFHLPVPGNIQPGTSVKVYHEKDLLGFYAVLTDGNGHNYVEVEHDTFSHYTVEVTDAVAALGNVEYTSFLDAMEAAAVSGGTVKLLQNVGVTKIVMVMDNVTLDLNGFTLWTSSYVMAVFENSYIIDSSESNTGRLDMDISMLRLLDANEQMAVQTVDGVMFADVKLEGRWSDKSSCYKFWFADSTDAAFIEQLKQGSAASKLKVLVELSWNSGANKMTYVFTDANLADYLENWQTYSLILNVGGADSIEDLSYTAKVIFADGAYAEVSTAATPVSHGAQQ